MCGRLCTRRQSFGMSQRRLEEFLGVSFQQIQKYERGTNRIAVTTLVRAATALSAPMSFFSRVSVLRSESPRNRCSMEATSWLRRRWRRSRIARSVQRFEFSFAHWH